MNSGDLRLKISSHTKDRVRLDDTPRSMIQHYAVDTSDRLPVMDSRRVGISDTDSDLRYLQRDMYDSYIYDQHRYYPPLPPLLLPSSSSSSRSAWSRSARPLSPVDFDSRGRPSPPPPYSSSSRAFTRAKSVGRCDGLSARKPLLPPADYDSRRRSSPLPPYSSGNSSSGNRRAFTRAKSVGRHDTLPLAPILKKSTSSSSSKSTSYNTVRSKKTSVCKNVVEAARDRKKKEEGKDERRSERGGGGQKHVSFKSTKSSSSSSSSPLRPPTGKKLFLAANKRTVGLFMDKTYNVFNVTKRRDETYVKMRTPWHMRTAVYSNDDKTLSTTCTVYEYNASSEFASRFLRRALTMEDKTLKVYSEAATTKTLRKTFARCDISKLTEDIATLDDRYETVNMNCRPNRRSTTCLFRWQCKRNSRCVYCKLEALHNLVNERSGIRVTKQLMYATDKRDSLLDKMVMTLMNERGAQEGDKTVQEPEEGEQRTNRRNKRKVSSSSSSLSSSSSESSESSSSSSSSESSSESSSSDSSSSSECSSDECEPSESVTAVRKKRTKSKRTKNRKDEKRQQQQPHKKKKKIRKNDVRCKTNTRFPLVEVSKASVTTHTTETTKTKTLPATNKDCDEMVAAAHDDDGNDRHDDDSRMDDGDEEDADYLCVQSSEIDWNPDDA